MISFAEHLHETHQNRMDIRAPCQRVFDRVRRDPGVDLPIEADISLILYPLASEFVANPLVKPGSFEVIPSCPHFYICYDLDARLHIGYNCIEIENAVEVSATRTSRQQEPWQRAFHGTSTVLESTN